MYEAYYRLKSKPFQLNPDPEFFFSSTPHSKAMAYLKYGLHQGEGFVVVTGEVGAGKTTLVRGLLGDLDPDHVVGASVVSTQLGAEDALRAVAAAFGIPAKGSGKSDVLAAVEEHLAKVAREGKRCLLVVDEAQNLTPPALEELRMLSNFQIGNRALLQTFLVGQAEFRRLLHSPEMRQLRQRVIAACHVGPLDAAETGKYIDHRLRCAGSTDALVIQEGAYAAVFKASRGIPRRINSLCDRLLLGGFLSEKREFSADDVTLVVAEFDDELLGDVGATVSDESPDRLCSHEIPASEYSERLAPQLAGIESRLQQLENEPKLCKVLADRLIAVLNQAAEAPRPRRRKKSLITDIPNPDQPTES